MAGSHLGQELQVGHFYIHSQSLSWQRRRGAGAGWGHAVAVPEGLMVRNVRLLSASAPRATASFCFVGQEQPWGMDVP